MLNQLIFNCEKCGSCCKQVMLNQITAFLDRGDGICRHLDLSSNLCTIYDERPLICRVDEFYEKFLKDTIPKEQYLELNRIACVNLQDSHQS